MKNFGFCFLVSSFLLFIVGSTTALNCFVCNSEFNEGCDGNPPEKYLVKCSIATSQPVFQEESKTDKSKSGTGGRVKRSSEEEIGPLLNTTLYPPPLNDNEYTFCRKVSLTIPEQNNGKDHDKPAHSRVVRSCGWVNESSTTSSGCRYGTGEGVSHYMCYCPENGCNDAGKLQNALILSVTLFMTTFIFWMVN